ncbi:MAG: hypothetical protein LW688_03865 [Cryomorphaceae bacterium]|nr:hypothetical protein [Cryomorphaceae bacterium]
MLIQKEWTIRQLLNGDLGGIVNCSIGPLSIRKKDGQLGNYSMGTWGALSIVTLDHCQFEKDGKLGNYSMGDLGGIVNCSIGPLSIRKKDGQLGNCSMGTWGGGIVNCNIGPLSIVSISIH